MKKHLLLLATLLFGGLNAKIERIAHTTTWLQIKDTTSQQRIAWCAVEIRQEKGQTPTAYLSGLYTVLEYRKKGLGKKLIQWAQQVARNAGCERLDFGAGHFEITNIQACINSDSTAAPAYTVEQDEERYARLMSANVAYYIKQGARIVTTDDGSPLYVPFPNYPDKYGIAMYFDLRPNWWQFLRTYLFRSV